MDVWIVLSPFLKVPLYVASFGSVGSFLFTLHFRKKLSDQQQSYCDNLCYKSTLIGAIISLVMILSVAGSLGGDLASVIDFLMLQLAIESKSGVGYLTAFSGFAIMVMAHNMKTKAKTVGLFIGSIVVMVPFSGRVLALC